MMLSNKRKYGQTLENTLKHQSIPNFRLVMTKESSLMMTKHTGNTSNLQWEEVSRRHGVEEVVVIWGGGCDMGFLRGFNLTVLICE
jgi:hypothetical protein